MIKVDGGSSMKLRDAAGVGTRVIGNGDLFQREDLPIRQAQSNVDGLMVGRGIFRDPLLFRTDERRFSQVPPAEKVAMMELHIREHQRVWAGQKGYDMLKSFYKIYTRDWEGGETLRDALNQTRSWEAALAVLDLHQALPRA